MCFANTLLINVCPFCSVSSSNWNNRFLGADCSNILFQISNALMSVLSLYPIKADESISCLNCHPVEKQVEVEVIFRTDTKFLTYVIGLLILLKNCRVFNEERMSQSVMWHNSATVCESILRRSNLQISWM